MLVDVEYTVKIKISEYFVNPKLTEDEQIEVLTKEGDRRLSYFLSGYLFDPEKKIITKEINFIKNK
jgi:hypothetical protein